MKTLAIFALFLAFRATAEAQTPCMTISQHPSFTYDNQCDPQEGCDNACTECRIVYVQNNTDCCVDEVIVRGFSHTCTYVCGEIANPTRSTWTNHDAGCTTEPKRLTAPLGIDELCLDKILAFKICSAQFPISIRVEWTCDGVLCTGDFIVN